MAHLVRRFAHLLEEGCFARSVLPVQLPVTLTHLSHTGSQS